MPVNNIKNAVLRAAFNADPNKSSLRVLLHEVDGEMYFDIWALVGGIVQQTRVKVADVLNQTELDIGTHIRLRCYGAIMAEKAPGTIQGL